MEQLEYFIMRSAINAISFILFGASMLVFISALLIPMLNKSISQGGDSVTGVYESSGLAKKTIEESAQEQTQGPIVINKPETSVTEFEGKVAPNDNAIDKNRVDSSVMQPPQTAPETMIPPIDEESPEPVNPTGAEEENRSPQEPMSLLVLGGGSFSPGEVRPKADVQEAIDKIIPLIQEQSLNNVIVEGHADNAIPDGFSAKQASKWNKFVSLQRAKAVARMLKRKGVANDRIIVKGLGDAVPLASNLTKEGRSNNRRVEIKLSAVR
jgi:outer membrane protein OmpA-like peptidoglycan-associated protein